MRYVELAEEEVLSSWISELNYAPQTGDIIMSLFNGSRYKISNTHENVFKRWLSSPSKGKFWHRNIKNLYMVHKI